MDHIEARVTRQLTQMGARRFKIRYKQDGEMVFPHTISSTGMTDRAALAILENHVQADGSVAVPKVLQPYLGGMERIERRKR